MRQKYCEACDYVTTHTVQDECVVCLELAREEWMEAATLVKGSDGPVMGDELTKLVERTFNVLFGEDDNAYNS